MLATATANHAFAHLELGGANAKDGLALRTASMHVRFVRRMNGNTNLAALKSHQQRPIVGDDPFQGKFFCIGGFYLIGLMRQ